MSSAGNVEAEERGDNCSKGHNSCTLVSKFTPFQFKIAFYYRCLQTTCQFPAVTNSKVRVFNTTFNNTSVI
jgi:hypothetical protein